MTTYTLPPTVRRVIEPAQVRRARFTTLRRRSWWSRWWVAVVVLSMLVASDWKWRKRLAQEALGGSADLQVLIELAVYAAVAIFLVLRYGRAPRLARTSGQMFAVWWFGATLFASAFYAVYPNLAIGRGVQLLIMCGLVQTIVSRATIEHLHRLAHGYMALLAFACVLGWAIHLPDPNTKIAGRFRWLHVHPVPAGIYLMIATVIAFAYLRSDALRDVLKIWPRWMYGAMFGWIGLGLILTKTRGSIGGFAVAMLVMAFYKTKARTKIDVTVIGITVGATVAVVFGGAILSYLARGENAAKLATLNERTNLWALAFTKFVAKPVTGYGLGASRGIFLDEIRLGGGHNAFVNVLVDAGILGTAAFLAVIVLVFASLVRFKRGTVGYRDSMLLLPILCGLLVNSMTAEFMAVPANNASMWLLIMAAWTTMLARADRSVGAANRPLPSPARAPNPALAGPAQP